MKYLAHIADDGREQTIAEHLRGTAELAAGFAAAFGAKADGYFAGLLHDIGKYTVGFQRRLHNGPPVDHATAGAREAFSRYGNVPAALAIAGHHGGIPDAGNPHDPPDEPTLLGRVKRLCTPDPVWMREISVAPPEPPAWLAANVYSLFRDLAIIILSAKFFGLVARKCKAPQVVGEIIAGLLIGPCLLNLVQISDSISIFAEIGVVMLMFTTGLGTNLKELIKAGPIATLIATVGVAVPLVGGTLLYGAFYGFAAVGSPEFYRALFIGTIMTATSVSITVATLQELGHLKSFLGTTIVSAAVIDDVIGIVVLTCVLGASSGTGTGLGKVLFNTVLFFATALGVGLVAHYAMKWLDQRNPHTQRITIVSMAFCFAMAYIAEEYFGIADITGAYIAGIVLCTMDDAPYVERRVDISNYVIFAPIFFASIGLKTDISGLTPEILLFCVCFVVVALITKIIGCGLAAKVCRFNWDDSLKVGVGMMTRGEVALIVAQKGLAIGVVDPVYFTAVILLIVVSSVATPLALKAMFTKRPPVPHPSQAN